MKNQVKKELQEIRDVLEKQAEVHASSSGKTPEGLKQDIDEYLESAPKLEEDEHDRKLGLLKKSIEEFEGAHPDLGFLIEKLITTLSNFGI